MAESRKIVIVVAIGVEWNTSALDLCSWY